MTRQPLVEMCHRVIFLDKFNMYKKVLVKFAESNSFAVMKIAECNNRCV